VAADEKQSEKVQIMSKVEGKCTAEMGEGNWKNKGKMIPGKK